MVVLVRGDAEVASWPLAGCGPPDLALVDELARLQLAARRLGYSIRLRGACLELSKLLDLVGLGEIITRVARPLEGSSPGGSSQCPQGLLPRPSGRASPALGFESGGEPEGGEQGGVEEVVHPDDPVA